MVFIGGVKIEFTYEIYNQNHDLLTTAHTVLVFVDMQTKRPIAVPDFLMELVR